MVPLILLAMVSATPALVGASNSGGPGSSSYFNTASADGTATVQILTPAMVGAGLNAPRAGMQPRAALDPNGSTPLLVYDFE